MLSQCLLDSGWSEHWTLAVPPCRQIYFVGQKWFNVIIIQQGFSAALAVPLFRQISFAGQKWFDNINTNKDFVLHLLSHLSVSLALQGRSGLIIMLTETLHGPTMLP